MAFSLSSLTGAFKKKEVIKRGPANSYIGLDFGTSAIKVVQIKIVKDVPTLETYGELQLGPYENSDIGRTTHLPNAKLVDAVVDVMREASVTGSRAGYAISYNSSYTNMIPIPTLDQNQIDSMLPVEARKYIPVSLTQVDLDWVPISIDEEKHTTNIMLSAVYKDAVTKYHNIVSGAELRSLASEIEIFSTVRSVATPEDTLIAIIDCGASSTRLYIVENGMVQKTHSVLLSGVGLTEAIAKELEIDFERAEEIKRAYGLHGKENDSRIQKTIVHNLERGFREFHTVLTRYETEHDKKIEKVILSGGGAQLQGLVTYACDMFTRPIRSAHPFEKIAYPAFLEDTVKEAGPSFAVSIGIALRLALES